MGGGLTVVSHTLSESKSKFIQKLVKSNVPGKIITAVMVTGDTLKRYGNGEISTQECMFELGENEEQLHYDIGVYAAAKNIDVIVALGQLGKNIHDGAKAAGHRAVYSFESVEEFLQQKDSILNQKDTILVKASHGMHLEKIVEVLS